MRTHLAGPTVNSVLRVIDLITGGVRDYEVAIAGGIGVIERVAWSPDNAFLYFIARQAPTTPLALDREPTFSVDLRSADIILYRLNLVTGVIRELARRPDAVSYTHLTLPTIYSV